MWSLPGDGDRFVHRLVLEGKNVLGNRRWRPREASGTYLGVSGIAGALTVASMWMPWVQIGDSTRNSFSIFKFAQISQLLPVDQGWIAGARFLWILAPFLLAGGLLMAASKRYITGLVIASFGGLYVALVAFISLATVGLRIGVVLAFFSAWACLALVGVAAVVHRNSICRIRTEAE